MAKFFPLIKTRTKIVEVPVGEGGELTRNSIRIDFRDKVAGFLTSIGIAPKVAQPIAFKTTDALVLIAKVFDTVAPKLSHFIGMRVFETAAPKDLPTLSPRVFEITGMQDYQAIAPRVFEALAAKETVRIDVIASVFDTAAPSDLASIAPRVFEIANGAQDSQTFTVTGNGYAESTVTTTGVTNPANVLGNNTATAATSSAASSGLAGTTSNTTNFDLIVELPNVNLSALISTIDTVTVNFEREGAVGGVSVGGTGTINMLWGFGGTPNNTVATGTFAVGQPLAKGISSANITAQVANDFTNINLLRLRFQGSVTSGAGLGATSTASFYRAWVSFVGNGAKA